MKKIFKTIAIGLSVALVAACNLAEYNPNEYNAELAFGSADAIQLAVNTFYSEFPSVTGAYSKDGSMDYVCTPFAFSNRYCVGYSAADDDLDWGGWDDLRDVNYFLEQMNSPACGVEGAVWSNFVGQGRFFRAFWYYKKMRSYGDLPWVDHVIRSNEPDYEWQDRTSRDEIMRHILEDLDYAIENVAATSVDNTTITKDICLFIKMQACLYEASVRKYNNVTASVKGEAFTVDSSSSGIVITPTPGAYRRGVLSKDIFPLTFSSRLHGDDVAWADVAEAVSATVKIPSVYEIADLEYFTFGEHGDDKRLFNWPHNYEPTYLITDFTKKYDVVSIEFAWQGNAENIQKSPRMIQLACEVSGSGSQATSDADDIYDAVAAAMAGVAGSSATPV